MKTVLSFKKETKGTVVYENKDSDLCKSVYLLKDAFPEGYPKIISLQVEVESGS
jgi:hypothetical protein